MAFGLCRSKMMNGIVALHSPPMRKDAAEKKGTLLRSAGCVGSRITRDLFNNKFKHVVAKCYPALLLRSNRSLLMLLWRRFFAFSSLWTGALVGTGREQAKRVIRNEQKDTTTSPLCWSAGANTVVSDQDQKLIRIWILTCRWFLTVGIMPGSWWAHHELGRGGWWFRDPVENASFMPWVLATARTFSIRSGLLASVHSFATDDTRGIFLWRFFLLMTGISMILFSQMKQQASILQLVLFLLWLSQSIGDFLVFAACDGVVGAEGPPSPPVVQIPEAPLGAPELHPEPPVIPVLDEPLQPD
ncbi:probable cytochrome c biosynthesis protein, partial [Arachis duranensis]|uniref:Probable cytochrome c biosynthesis protein n=1 Tax=Arachis duranensis TaxID=130453 RepID=A0A9C6TPQ0_ARADU